MQDTIVNSLQLIDDQLRDVQKRREILIRGTRDAVAFASKSIVSMHQGRFEEARKQIENAKASMNELRPQAQNDLYKYIAVAEQELVEACTLIAVMNDSALPTNEELGVSGAAYLTGLLDCIGEIKRLVYDRMRSGKEKDAEALFSAMEELYGAIFPFAIYDNIVPGLRKKLDVARILIEDIRAAVTEEVRRRVLISAMDKLEKP